VGEIIAAASAGGTGSGTGQPAGEIRVFSTCLVNARPRRFSAAKCTRRIGSVSR
jgi:hypothetical protein